MSVRLVVYFFFDFIICFLPLLLLIAFLTLAERKVMASLQKRRGPNVVGAFGIFQPIADGVKLLLKDLIVPFNADKVIFFFSPLFVFFLSLVNWSIIPFNSVFFGFNVELGILFIFALSSLNVYGIIMAGWASNSKYAFLGAIRAVAQMLSYEVVLFLSIFPIVLITGSLNFIDIVLSQKLIWYVVVFPISSLLFLISMFAETNRVPFDLPEAEGELVSGFNVEYSSMTFAMFFLAEYSNIILASILFVIFFLGGWNPLLLVPYYIIFSIKVCFLLYVFILIRAILPRYRFDQLIELSWKILLPVCLGNLVIYLLFLIFF